MMYDAVVRKTLDTCMLVQADTSRNRSGVNSHNDKPGKETPVPVVAVVVGILLIW